LSRTGRETQFSNDDGLREEQKKEERGGKVEGMDGEEREEEKVAGRGEEFTSTQEE
jgi:hypothetical protein